MVFQNSRAFKNVHNFICYCLVSHMVAFAGFPSEGAVYPAGMVSACTRFHSAKNAAVPTDCKGRNLRSQLF